MLSHFLLMVLHSFLIGLFFAFLWRETPRERTKLFLQFFLGMIGGGLLVAWLMYPFPSGPPANFP